MREKRITQGMNYDTAVVGGGPAGMLAAWIAASAGRKVVLIEKNPSLGKKLLITGKGRCNITNAEWDIEKLISKYGKNGLFLYSGFNRFGPARTLEFFERSGLRTKIDRGKRVFPLSDRSEDVLNILLSGLDKNNVTVRTSCPVREILICNSTVMGMRLHDNTVISALNYIIATGGASYPSTGSSGDGYEWARKAGHTVRDLHPSIVPLTTKEDWVKDLSGLSLRNVAISAYVKEKKILERFGEMLITHFGISGPIIMDCSKYILENLNETEVKVYIDLKPALDQPKLDKRIQRDLVKHKGKQISNALKDLIPLSLIPVILQIAEVAPQLRVDQLTRIDRKKILNTIKAFPLSISGSLGLKWAIVTSGGINTDEIVPSSMRSKVINNLFFAGEILDIDGPTGGFNLQVCWTTGYLAGKAVSL